MARFNGLRAYVFVHQNADKQADAYGVSVKLSGVDYAIASVYLPEPTSVNEAIRRALAWIVSIKRYEGEIIEVFGHTAAFKYHGMKARVTSGIVTAKLYLSYLPAENAEGTTLLAGAAIRRRTTITERL